MELLDGKALSAEIRKELKHKVAQVTANGRRPPHLVAVLVGDNPASQSYVRNKMRSCDEVGFQSTVERLPASISQDVLLQMVDQLNQDTSIDGFIVQLPLPDHIDETAITLAIAPEKDVDGFHPVNFGRMAQGLSSYLPATPAGILEMLKRSRIETSGKDVVVIGRSNIVGTPISILLSRKGDPGNATVTLCHSRTKDLKDKVRQADIIIAAIGRPNFVTADMVKPGAIVIDVGINRVDDDTRKRGYRLVGDVAFEQVAPLSSFITPVPGGVGPMTVAALLLNTWKAYNHEVFS